VSALPILALFFTLIVLKKRVWVAAATGLAVAFVGAVGFFGMPANLAVIAAGHGVVFGMLRIAWIIVTAIFLYNVSRATGQFEVMKD
jgi:lactate permease